jgi:hypothetical protein
MIAKALLLLLLCGCLAAPASAHKPSDSYLSLNVDGSMVTGQWDISLRDLEYAIGLDADGDGKLTWDEVRARHSAIAAYALSRLQLSSADTACPARATEHLIDDHVDGAYAVLRFTAACDRTIDTLGIRYRLLFDADPQHKGLLKLEHDGQTSSAIFSVEQAERRFSLTRPGRWQQFADYVGHGIWHIWIGFDHILFLLSLLLPAVLMRQGRRWLAAPSFRAAAIDVLKIVTAFTLAHSLTLTLATLGLVQLPSRWVETAIAASVIVAALNNLVPLLHERRWYAAFAFGLIHGLGFAGVLADLGLPTTALFAALAGFNLGVELGQLAIVAVFFPLAYLLRRSWAYQRVIVRLGSALVVLIASMWMMERAFGYKLFYN